MKDEIANLSLKIYKSDKILNLKIVKKLDQSHWRFNFDYLLIEPNKRYKLVFHFQTYSFEYNYLSRTFELEKCVEKNSKYEFSLHSTNSIFPNCIRSISFCSFIN